VVPALAAVLWLLTLLQEAGVEVLIGDNTLRLVLAFLVGSAAWLYAERIPMTGPLMLLAVVVTLASIATLENYRIVAIVPAAYVLIWLGACLPWTRSLRRDLSYGIYIYHWPVLQLLAATGLVSTPVPVFIVLGGALTMLLALASWHGIEHPALRQKHRTPPWSKAGAGGVTHQKVSTASGAASRVPD
jgi:peptidoglycan/LPS O-acetylase OafA/YrhL